jgi:predicted ATPase with chaperone activity
VERCVAVASTVAALDAGAEITLSHVQEALEFRREVLAG